MADTLTITDNRTGKQYECRSPTAPSAPSTCGRSRPTTTTSGLMTYDPAFMNTASCRSRITYIDGDKGILEYRGYPIEQLAEHSTYLETAYLILFGELPTAAQLKEWTHEITMHTMVHENIKKFMEASTYDAHPMGVFLSTVGALSTFYPDGKQIFDEESRKLQIHRLIAKVPTIAAYAYRHSIGRPYVYPDNDLSFTGNFLNMLFKMTELKYKPNPVLERALDVLFILHADHEQNCSTSAMRGIGSSQVDPYSALAGAAAALYGPLHGGANEAVLRMLKEIGSSQHPRLHQAREGRRRPPDGLRPPRLQVVRPARQDHQEDGVRGVRGHGQEPAARHRARARADRARGRLLRQPQALPERGLLLGPHLPGDGLPRGDVPGALRHPAHGRLGRAVGGDADSTASRRSRGPRQIYTGRFVGANDGRLEHRALLELARVLKDRPRPVHARVPLLRRRGSLRRVEDRLTPTAAGTTCRRPAQTARCDAQGAHPAGHDRRPRPQHPPRSNSTPWLTDIIWAAAQPRSVTAQHFLDESTPIEDDHIPFLQAGVPAVDIIDLDYPPGTRPATRSTRSAPQPAGRRRRGAGRAARTSSAPAQDALITDTRGTKTKDARGEVARDPVLSSKIDLVRLRGLRDVVSAPTGTLRRGSRLR
jgi:hypothetical protein